MEFTLLWAALTAVAFGWVGLRVWNERLPEHAADRLLTATLLGLAAGRITAMLIQGVNPLTGPADIIILRGGVDTGAAALVFIVTLAWTNRNSPAGLDAVAPTVLLALAGWHTGCVWRSACLGTPSDLPWAWAQAGSAVTRHPVELYAAIALAFGAFLVSRFGWRPWLRAGTALLLASGIRLATEPIRPSITGGPVVWYVAGMVVGALTIMLGPRLTRLRTRAPT